MTRIRLAGLAVMATVAVLNAGCGAMSQAAAEVKLKGDLKTLGLAYLSYHDAHSQGPASWDEIIKHDPEYAEAIQHVRDAGYVVKWGVKMSDAKDGVGNFVLAESPSGGPKLMLDATVQ